MRNFALTGAAGFVAPRHLEAIRATRGRLVAALDPHDSVGVLDRYTFDVRYFTEYERFDRFLEKLRRGPEEQRLHYLSVCAPNHLHDAHCRLGLRVGADVICEKPLVVNPWNLEALEELEAETGRRVWTVLQLRTHEKLVALREELQRTSSTRAMHDVVLTYVTARGPWYDVSWKGQPAKSGGIPTNIGVHFFDMLIWLFGDVIGLKVHLANEHRAAGFLELERARVRWFLSIAPRDLPRSVEAGKTTHRSIAIDGSELEFSESFGDLHTRVYELTLAGKGFGIDDARPGIGAAHAIRHAPLSPPTSDIHPFLER